MLYDPRWEKEHKPYTKYARFVSWLEKQPADGKYFYPSAMNCGYARYLRSWGVLALVGPASWQGLWLGVVPCFGRVPHDIDTALIQPPYTFGAALQRLRG